MNFLSVRCARRFAGAHSLAIWIACPAAGQGKSVNWVCRRGFKDMQSDGECCPA
jgi:hypothetical protein